jgi:excisionase family DNA binding protein
MKANNNNRVDLNPIYTAEEAAQYLRLDVVSLWRLRRSGKLSALKAGGKVLFTHSALQDFVRNNMEVCK